MISVAEPSAWMLAQFASLLGAVAIPVGRAASRLIAAPFGSEPNLDDGGARWLEHGIKKRPASASEKTDRGGNQWRSWNRNLPVDV
jgi:hypothetical protein